MDAKETFTAQAPPLRVASSWPLKPVLRRREKEILKGDALGSDEQLALKLELFRQGLHAGRGIPAAVAQRCMNRAFVHDGEIPEYILLNVLSKFTQRFEQKSSLFTA